jgi:SAM-dependent methyltransferase
MPKFACWIPTLNEFIDALFELVPLTSSDVVYDLGAGDGRLLFTALEKGAGKGVGIEIDPDWVGNARYAAKCKGLSEKVTFIEADVLEIDLSLATVILCYLDPSASAALRSKFEKELKPGTRVIMESFPVPGWQPVKIGGIKTRNFYLYIMPPAKTQDYENVVNYLNFKPFDEYFDYYDVASYTHYPN